MFELFIYTLIVIALTTKATAFFLSAFARKQVREERLVELFELLNNRLNDSEKKEEVRYYEYQPHEKSYSSTKSMRH